MHITGYVFSYIHVWSRVKWSLFNRDIYLPMWVDFTSIVTLYAVVALYLGVLAVLGRGFQTVAQNQI
jgi:hypothetical protein